MKPLAILELSGLIRYVVFFLFVGSFNAHASDLIIQRTASRGQNIVCRTASEAVVPIIDQRQEVPIKINYNDTSEQSIISYDSWRFAEVPTFILHFEQARKCIELSSPQMAATIGGSPSSRPSSSTDPANDEIEAKIDCLAINLLRDQGLISSQELQEIAQFYARYGDVEKKKGKDPRRGKNILDCFQYYKQYQRIAPPKGMILK